MELFATVGLPALVGIMSGMSGFMLAYGFANPPSDPYWYPSKPHHFEWSVGSAVLDGAVGFFAFAMAITGLVPVSMASCLAGAALLSAAFFAHYWAAQLQRDEERRTPRYPELVLN